MTRSDYVHVGVKKVSRFLLCHLAAKATRGFHTKSDRLEDVINLCLCLHR